MSKPIDVITVKSLKAFLALTHMQILKSSYTNLSKVNRQLLDVIFLSAGLGRQHRAGACCIIDVLLYAAGLPPGCLYEGRWFSAGASVPTGEACLQCACAGGALSCRRRACAALPDPPPHRCHVLHRRGSCCPELHCPGTHNVPCFHNDLIARSCLQVRTCVRLQRASVTSVFFVLIRTLYCVPDGVKLMEHGASARSEDEEDITASRSPAHGE